MSETSARRNMILRWPIGVRLISLFLLVIFALCSPLAHAQENQTRRVLVLNSYHKGFGQTDDIVMGIEDVLNPEENDIELTIEYMDTKAIEYDPQYQEILFDLYTYKYSNQTFDLIISSDDNAFNFLREYHEELFPGVPIVFCGVNNLDAPDLIDPEVFTGIIEQQSIRGTIDLALGLHPQTRQIVFVVDTTPTGVYIWGQIQALFVDYQDIQMARIDDGLSMEQVEDEVSNLSDDAIVLYGPFHRDNSGRYYSFEESVSRISQASAQPMYGLSVQVLPYGIVGGKLFGGFYHGQVTAEIAQRILGGEDVRNIPVVERCPAQYMFNYEQLERWGIGVSDLPEDSIVVNRPHSFYEENKELIWGVIAIVTFQAAIIAILLINISRRKRAEEREKHLNAVLRAIRNVNQLIVQEKDRDLLLQGACDNFIETRGYHNAWIALINNSGALATAAAGLDEAFPALDERLRRGEWSYCAQQALAQPGALGIADPPATCADCPLADKYGGRGAMAVRLEHEGKVYGLLAVSVPAEYVTDEDERSLLEEIAEDIAFALHSMELDEVLRGKTRDLGERVKELNCLYGISDLAAQPDMSLAAMLQGVVELIPPAWRYPEITCSRLTIAGQVAQTDNFSETTWKQSSDVMVGGNRIGVLEVCYLEERPESDEGPFVQEERSLLNAITEQLGLVTERKRAEEREKHLNAVLRAIRNVNQLIVQEKDRDRLLQGACDNFVATRGYHNAWIALVDDSGALATAAAGLDEAFPALDERLRRGEWSYCAQQALAQPGALGIADPPTTCGDCPLADKYGGRGAMVVRLEHEGRVYGLLTVSVPAEYVTDEDEISLLEEIAEDIAFALHSMELEEAHKQAEESLQESEEQYRFLADNALDCIWQMDQDLRFTYVNPAVLPMFGFTQEEWTGGALADHCSTDEMGKVMAIIAEMVQKGTYSAIFEMYLSHKDGRDIPTEINGKMIFDENGNPVGFQGSTRDITKRKRADEARRESEAQFKDLVEQSPVSIQIMNPDGQTVQVNRAWEELWGVTLDDLGDYNMLHDEQLERLGIKPYIEKAFSGEAASIPEGEYDARDTVGKGIKRWVAARIYPVKDEKGDIRRVILMHEDITERKRAEEEIRKLSRAIEQSPVSVIITDMDSNIEYVNPKFTELTGYSLEEMLGQNPRILSSGEQPPEFHKTLWETITAGQEWRGEFHNKKKDGDLYWESASISPIRNNEGVITHFLAVKEDITERKRAEDEIRKLSQAIEHSPNIVFITNVNGEIEYANPKFTAITGYSAEEAIGRLPRILDPDKIPPEEHEERWRAIRSGNEWRGEFYNRKKDGQRYWEFVSISSIRDEDGAIAHLVIVEEDITARKRGQEALRESEGRFRTLVQAAQDAIIVIDETEQVIIFNPAAERMFGHAAEHMIGGTLARLLPEEMWEQHSRSVRRYFETGQSAGVIGSVVELEASRADGDLFPIELSLAAAEREGKKLVIATIRDITERKAAEAAQRESEERYRLVSELSSDYAYAVRIEPDGTRVREWATEGLARITGYSLQEVAALGGWDALAHPDDVLAVRARIENIYNGQEVENEFRIITKNGEICWLHDNARPVWDEAGDRIVRVYGSAQDITERKRAEDALRKRTEEVSLLYEASTQLGRTLDLEALYDTVYQVVAKTMPCDSLSISSFNMEDSLIRCVYARIEGQRLDESELPPIPLATEGKGTQSRVVQSGESLYLADYRTYLKTAQTKYHVDVNEDGRVTVEDEKNEVSEDADVTRSALIVPLKLGDRVLGVIQAQSYAVDAYSEGNRRILEALAPQLAAATANASLYESEREQRALAEALRDTAATISGTLDPDLVMNRILENVGRVVPHDAANFMLIEGDVARVSYWSGYPADYADFFDTHSFPLDSTSNLREMLTSGKPTLIADTTSYPDWATAPETGWVRSYIAVPIRSRGGVIGFLNLDSATPDFFRLDQLERLQAFADQAAIAIENAQVYRTLIDYSSEIATLYRATSFLFTTLSTAQDLDEIGRQIVQAITQVFGELDCGVMLVDEARGEFVRLARAEGRQIQATLRLDGPGLVPEATRTKEEIYAPDVTADPRYVPNVAETRTEFVIPLQTGDRVIGVLDLQSQDLDAFNEQDRRALLAFADGAATAIENVQLYETIRNHAEQLERRVTERTQEMIRSKERVETILNSSSDAIVLVETDGAILQTNPAFETMFRYQVDETFGQPFTILVAPDDAEVLRESLFATPSDSEARRIEVVARRKDGTTFDADMAVAPIIGRTQLSGFVCSARDITVRKQAEIKLRETLEQEKELSELKSRFVSMTSHEFRTPMTTILSSAFLLEKRIDRMTAEQKQRHFTKIKISIDNMTQLLDDVLVVGKADAGRLEFNPLALDLETLSRDAVEAAQIGAGSNLDVVFASAGPCNSVVMDEKQMRHILTNLLSNAVKYSPDGGTVHFDLQCSDQETVLTVQDEGIGIPEADQARLFETFHRAGNVGAIQGTGLGLAIMKRAVDLHGGTISFESEVGSGTTFVVTIPVIPMEKNK